MDKITVTSTESTLAASTLKDRCILCNGINGHHGTCPTLNVQPEQNVYQGRNGVDWESELEYIRDLTDAKCNFNRECK